MSGTQKDIYNVDAYTDVELYNILDLTNPTDRELEAKLLHMIWKYDNMNGSSADKLSNFFKKIYDRFFDSQDDNNQNGNNQDDNNQDVTMENMENMENMTPIAKQSSASPETNFAQTIVTELATPNEITNQLDSTNRTFSYNIPIDYSKDNLNPLLKQTTKRIVVIDSQYRENKSTSSSSFTFNLSNPLKDVVSLKLYSFQIPYTWWTINNNFGSNFFYLKGNSQGILDNGNDLKITISPGNYTAQSLVTAVNDSIKALQTDINYLDICFGTTNISYNNTNSKSSFTFDIKKIFNEGDYEIYFPYWDSPQTPTATNGIQTNNSIPGFLGLNFKYYSPNVVYGLYNQLPGYNLSALAGAYSVGNNVLASYQYPTTDDTVNIYYLDSSNNYFDITITDKNGFSDISNATIYGSLRITLSNLATGAFYTRNELVQELNTQLSINPFLDNVYSKLNRVFDPLYIYYMDPYIVSQQNLVIPTYMPSPAYPYLYLPNVLLNPFCPANASFLTPDYPFYPLFIQKILQPDPTNTNLLLPNPFYNAKLLDPSANNAPVYPWLDNYIYNPFDPLAAKILNPYYFPTTQFLDNPLRPLFTDKNLYYVFYIDVKTIQDQSLNIVPYIPTPTYPYMFLPKYIPNPFGTFGTPLNNSNVYYPLYTKSTIQPDPEYTSSTVNNPFYNPKLLYPNQSITRLSYPFNTKYIPNVFDPNLNMIPNPLDISNSTPYTDKYNIYVSGGYMINPYYAQVSKNSINWKYYIDFRTYYDYYNVENYDFDASGNYHVYLPTYPYMYAPKLIYNPFANSTTPYSNLLSLSKNYAYWPLFTQPTIQPDPTNSNLILPNPFYNVKLTNPSASNTPPQYPFIPDPSNNNYILNPFDPSGGIIPSPYYYNNSDISHSYPNLQDGTHVPDGYMINPYYSLISTTILYYKYYIDAYTYKFITIKPEKYITSPIYPYLYVPQIILNPFYGSNLPTLTSTYAYWPLFTNPIVVPDLAHPSISYPNPFYNAKILNPSAPTTVPSYPFNTPYINNPFDSNAGFIPNPYDFSGNYYPIAGIPPGYMINPYYALISNPSINYKYYIDSYTFTQKSLITKPYTSIPIYPYLYVPVTILNPFNTSNQFTSNYPYYSFFTQPTIQPDPSKPNMILPNPFYNAKLLDPSANNAPIYPFNTAYIPNPFDPNAVGIPNPFDNSKNSISSSITLSDGTVITINPGYMINPYYPLTSVSTIKYKFYIDSYTYVQKNLFSKAYNFSPLYPYLYLPPVIMNPFNLTNQTTLQTIYGPKIPYYELFTQATIQPDPIYHRNFILPNPFYNAKILNPSASNTPTYPWNSSYIQNPFDPNAGFIPNPYDFSGNYYPITGIPAGYMINPYYALLFTSTITYKYYIDAYTYQFITTLKTTLTSLLSQLGPYYITLQLYGLTDVPITSLISIIQTFIDQGEIELIPLLELLIAITTTLPPIIQSTILSLSIEQLIAVSTLLASLPIQNYIATPIYPYSYVPQIILNPFTESNLPSLTSTYAYWTLFINPIMVPDPTQPNISFPNPFYNAKILNPSAPTTEPNFPFNTLYISNPFDPNLGLIPNPYYNSNNDVILSNGMTIPAGYMINPYYALENSPTINYKYYIDVYTYKFITIHSENYVASPIYPYLYVPRIILNPFYGSNLPTLTSTYAYWPLFTNPIVVPDPTQPSITYPNPFYNAKVLNPSAPTTVPSYPFNTPYINNPFDPNVGLIPNPYDFSGNYYPIIGIPPGYMINPYYALINTPTINYKFYIDSYTFTQQSLITKPYFPSPVHPYLYCPTTILNPFNATNQSTLTSTYPYWPLYIQPTIQPDPSNNPSFLIPNPFYNAKLLDPSANNISPYPSIIENPFDPNNGLMPNPYYNQSDTSMNNPYSAIFTSEIPHSNPITTNTPTNINNIIGIPNPGYNINANYDISNNNNTKVTLIPNPGYNINTIYDISNNNNTQVASTPNPGYNPFVITATAGTISVPTDITNVTIIPNPGYNFTSTIITATSGAISVPTDISNVSIVPNPGYNINANYDISNNNINQVASGPNPAYNSKANYDSSNTNIKNSKIIVNVAYNSKAIYDINNQFTNQSYSISNPYYNPNISDDIANPLGNWTGSSFSHYELRLKLNRLTMPVINSSYSKKPVPNVIDQKIIVRFPKNDTSIWFGGGSAFLFNPEYKDGYPLSLMIAETPIYETKVSFDSTPTINYRCVKQYYDIKENNYTSYVLPNIDICKNILPYNFSTFMNNINSSLTIMNNGSINPSNPNGVFKIGASPSYIDANSSNTLFYKNSESKLNISTDITKTFNNIDYFLDLGTGKLIQSLGLTEITYVTSYDASNNPIGPTIYLDVSKNLYENSQYYGGYGMDCSGDFWVTVGQGGGNTIVYSDNSGNSWKRCTTTNNSLKTNTLFTVRGNKVKYNGNASITGSRWVAVGKSGNIAGNIAGNSIAYSTNGITWKGLGGNIFSTECIGIDYNPSGNVWVAVGNDICGNTIAYTDPTKSFVDSWTKAINTPFDGGVANSVCWNNTFNLWVAVGNDICGNTIAISNNGKNWTSAQTNPFGIGGIGYNVSCNGNIWVAVGSSPTSKTSIAYATINGNILNWTPVPTGDLFRYGKANSISYNGNVWMVGGTGIDILATSNDGKIWTSENTTVTSCAKNTFIEGINSIKWSGNTWKALGNCGLSDNSFAYLTNGNTWIVGNTQPYPSGLNEKTTYNINLSSYTDNTLILKGIFPVNEYYTFLPGNFLTLIPNPNSANKYSNRELLDITYYQSQAFVAKNTTELANLINNQFSIYSDEDGDYVLNSSNIVLEPSGNQIYATLKIIVRKYLTQKNYNLILNDPKDISFNATIVDASYNDSTYNLVHHDTTAWQDSTNIWWKYLNISYWNYPLYYTTDLSGTSHYWLNGEDISGQFVINNSISILKNISGNSLVRPNSITIRDKAESINGVILPINNKIIIQPQTVTPRNITEGDTTADSPNANPQRKQDWVNINPISGLTTENITDATSKYYGYGYNTVIITIPNGDYSSDELIAVINNNLNASPYISTTNQTVNPLLTYNNKCITFGSGFKFLSVANVGNVCELFFNINMIYNSGDYLLNFFNPYEFSTCSTVSNKVQNASWDSTLGWILGFRNFTEYPLSAITPNVTNTNISQYNLLQIIASNIQNNIFSVTTTQIQNIIDPSLQPYIVFLEGDTAVSITIYNYFLITLDDFNQNHLNDGLVTTSQSETDIPLPSYTNRAMLKCDQNTQLLSISTLNTNSSSSNQNAINVQRNLTQKQIYASQEILNTMQTNTQNVNSSNNAHNIIKQNIKYYSNGPFAQDVFALVPLKLSGQQNNTIYIDFSGTLQNQERVYFGPVNIQRMSVSLLNDRGEKVDLNGANWAFSLICEQLYQQKKT